VISPSHSGPNSSTLLCSLEYTPLYSGLLIATLHLIYNYFSNLQLFRKRTSLLQSENYAGAPDIILKSRDAHFCQVSVDRAGLDHYQGPFDEDEHLRDFKQERHSALWFQEIVAPIRFRSSKKPGYDFATASASLMVTPPVALTAITAAIIAMR
jgi:hypothetical protein